MLVVISPAKKLDMMRSAPEHDGAHDTVPVFADRAASLAAAAARLRADDLQKLMGISPNLAQLNAERFQTFDTQPRKPAALAFAGDTYQGLEASTLDDHEMAWAQDHLRILSGLYGLLRPMDAIAPYRLEMGSKFNPNEDANKSGTLYQYWGSDIADALNRQAEKTDARGLVNCASQEYFSAVDLKTLTMPVITPVFKEMKDGKAKIISFFAKKARGAMARYMTQHNITNPDDLAGFSSGGYVFQPDQSNANTLTFLRISA